jgi:dethiobiotin synthetase
VILVARSSLGTINHTLLSLDVLNRNGLEVIGVVMNGPKNQLNKNAIETYGRVRVILEIEPMRKITRDALAKHFNAMEWL